MPDKVAVLLDGGFVVKRLQELIGVGSPTASDVLKFAHKCAYGDEQLFRVYYYDCYPFGRKLTNPLNKQVTDYGNTPQNLARTQFLDDLAVSNHVALRRGELKCGGWRIRKKSQFSLIKRGRAVVDSDLEPDFRQKRVDMKIGLDVAWLSSKHIVDTIILVSADTDFVPAMKFARREGVKVVVVPMNCSTFKGVLREHADEVRNVLP